MKETTSFNDWEKGKKGAKAKASKKGKVTDFHVEKLDNGFQSTATHEPPPPAKDDKMRSYMERPQTKTAHPNIQHAADHMVKMFGGAQAVPSTPESGAEDAAAGASGQQA